jgi:hypothetical protein
MHTQSTVDTCAAQADEDAEFGGGPLWRRRSAVATAIVPVGFLNLQELSCRELSIWSNGGEGVSGKPGLITLDRVSGSTCHMALAMLQLVCVRVAEIST